MTTIGLSPKLVPALGAIGVGFALVLIGERDTGLGVLLTGVSTLGLGYKAPAGAVSDPVLDGGSDSRLPPEATDQLR